MTDSRVQTAAQTAEEIRRRPLVQYVITRQGPAAFVIDRSMAGMKPGHTLIFGVPLRLGTADTLASARSLIPAGCRNVGRRRDDPPELVEVWV